MRRQHVPRGDGVQQRGHHQGEADLGDAPAHLGLRGDDVADHLRQRAVVADARRQDEVHAVLDRVVHDPVGDRAILDGGADRAGLTDAVDGADVVLVAVFGGHPVGQRDAQRRAVEVALDVVGRQRVAGEQHVHVARPYQGAGGLDAAGVHQRRPGDPQHLLAGGLGLAHPLRHLVDEKRLGLLRRHRRRHEPEAHVGGVHAGLLRRRHADAPDAQHHLHARAGVVHGQGPGPSGVRVIDDPAVHLRGVDVDPAAVHPDAGGQVRRRVEALRQDTVPLDDPQRRVLVGGGVGAIGLQSLQQRQQLV